MKTNYLVLIVIAFFINACTNSEKEEVTDQTETDVTNVFFSEFNTPHGVPDFENIKSEDYKPAYLEAFKKQKEIIDGIVNNQEEPTFENTLAVLDGSSKMFDRVNYVFKNLLSANFNDTLIALNKEFAPLISKHQDDISLNAGLFAKIKTLYDKKEELDLTAEQAILLDKVYKKFERNGANLDAEKQAKLRKINEELSLLSPAFRENVMNEVNEFKLVIDKEEDLAGLPEGVRVAASEAAKARDLEGKWLFTIQKPSLLPFLQFSEKRELREKMYKAYITKGDKGDENDNKENIKKILNLRIEKANLFGFKNHAEYVLEPNMAQTPENVINLLNQLWEAALPVAKNEVKDMQKIADSENANIKIEAWDWWFYAEKVKKAQYDFDDETIRPYFKLENVRDGAFEVAKRLWGLNIVERKDIPVYHKDVQAFEIQEADGSHIGILYMDFYVRESKNGGAWMSSFRKQQGSGDNLVTPVITNVLNFPNPTSDTPSLLSIDQVTTLFHEFGHGLHGLLSKCEYNTLSGTSVARDFVELPSQIMENWALDPEVMKIYAKHYQTGEVIPQELLDKMNKATYFNQGFVTVEYLAASFLDMKWHTIEKPIETTVTEFENQALSEIGLIPEIASRYRSTYFSHIFSSMYSAGYYSYTWAAQLDADGFEAFKENGLFDKATAEAFRSNVLSKGGTAKPMELYKNFRGREPKIDALLRRKGFVSL